MSACSMHIKTTRVTSQNYWLPPPPCHNLSQIWWPPPPITVWRHLWTTPKGKMKVQTKKLEKNKSLWKAMDSAKPRKNEVVKLDDLRRHGGSAAMQHARKNHTCIAKTQQCDCQERRHMDHRNASHHKRKALYELQSQRMSNQVTKWSQWLSRSVQIWNLSMRL